MIKQINWSESKKKKKNSPLLFALSVDSVIYTPAVWQEQIDRRQALNIYLLIQGMFKGYLYVKEMPVKFNIY